MAYLADGLADALIHDLSRLGVQIAARTSSFAFRTRAADVPQIARELGVNVVIEGALRTQGELLLVTLQLIDGASGMHLESQFVERPLARLLELEDELARAVACALGVAINEIRVSGGDSQARDQYMHARALVTIPTPTNLKAALEFLLQATTREPRFARAWALLAAVYSTCVEFDYPVPDAMAQAQRAAFQALSLDARDGACLAAMGVVQALQGPWLLSEDHFRRARDCLPDPFLNNLHCVYVSTATGHLRQTLDEALQAHKEAAAQQFGATMIALTRTFMGHDSAAAEWALKCAQLGEPSWRPPLADLLAQLALRSHRYAEAETLLVESFSPPIKHAGAAQAVRQFVSALQGATSKGNALKSLAALEQVRTDDFDQTTRKRLLVWYSMLNELDAAYSLMDRSLQYYASKGFVGSTWGLLWMPELRPFRQDQRFQSFVSRLGLMPYWQTYGPPDGHRLRNGVLVGADRA